MDKKPNLKKAAALEDIEEYGEGLYYFFVCEACGVAAANYTCYI